MYRKWLISVVQFINKKYCVGNNQKNKVNRKKNTLDKLYRKIMKHERLIVNCNKLHILIISNTGVLPMTFIIIRVTTIL